MTNAGKRPMRDNAASRACIDVPPSVKAKKPHLRAKIRRGILGTLPLPRLGGQWRRRCRHAWPGTAPDL